MYRNRIPPPHPIRPRDPAPGAKAPGRPSAWRGKLEGGPREGPIALIIIRRGMRMTSVYERRQPPNITAPQAPAQNSQRKFGSRTQPNSATGARVLAALGAENPLTVQACPSQPRAVSGRDTRGGERSASRRQSIGANPPVAPTGDADRYGGRQSGGSPYGGRGRQVGLLVPRPRISQFPAHWAAAMTFPPSGHTEDSALRCDTRPPDKHQRPPTKIGKFRTLRPKVGPRR